MIATTPADAQFESWYELIKTVHHAFEYDPDLIKHKLL